LRSLFALGVLALERLDLLQYRIDGCRQIHVLRQPAMVAAQLVGLFGKI
jgi:hypothetical protein